MEWIDRGCTKENGMEDEIIESTKLNLSSVLPHDLCLLAFNWIRSWSALII